MEGKDSWNKDFYNAKKFLDGNGNHRGEAEELEAGAPYSPSQAQAGTTPQQLNAIANGVRQGNRVHVNGNGGFNEDLEAGARYSPSQPHAGNQYQDLRRAVSVGAAGGRAEDTLNSVASVGRNAVFGSFRGETKKTDTNSGLSDLAFFMEEHVVLNKEAEEAEEAKRVAIKEAELNLAQSEHQLRHVKARHAAALEELATEARQLIIEVEREQKAAGINIAATNVTGTDVKTSSVATLEELATKARQLIIEVEREQKAAGINITATNVTGTDVKTSSVTTNKVDQSNERDKTEGSANRGSSIEEFVARANPHIPRYITETQDEMRAGMPRSNDDHLNMMFRMATPRVDTAATGGVQTPAPATLATGGGQNLAEAGVSPTPAPVGGLAEHALSGMSPFTSPIQSPGSPR